MRRLSLVSTAVLGLAAASPALAQQTEPVQPTPPSQQPATPGTGAVTTEVPAPGTGTVTTEVPAPRPVPEQAEHQVRAEGLLGLAVSDGQATIGEVSDLVVTRDGRVEAVVVGVGGFLGIGEKRVALAWDSVRLTERDGERVFLVSATREQLDAMPAFRTLEDRRAEEAAVRMQRQMQQQPGAAAPGVGVTPAPALQPGSR
jgi:hypothetical protein